MLKKVIKYTDYNGVEREEEKYFNFNKAELMEMELTTVGGLSGLIEKIIKTKDYPSLVKMFKGLILDSYGEKSADGVQFEKSESIRKRFEQSEAYSELFMELATNSESAANFVNGIIPKDLRDQVEKEAKDKKEALEAATN